MGKNFNELLDSVIGYSFTPTVLSSAIPELQDRKRLLQLELVWQKYSDKTGIWQPSPFPYTQLNSDRPMLGTINSGSPNLSVALAGSDGSAAILMEEIYIDIAAMTAIMFARFAFPTSEMSEKHFLPFDGQFFDWGSLWTMFDLHGLFLSTGRLSFEVQEHYLSSFSNFHFELAHEFFLGFVASVLSHEKTHLSESHHSLRLESAFTKARLKENVTQGMERWRQGYFFSLDPPSDDELKSKFLFAQELEFSADIPSIEVNSRIYASNPLCPKAYCRLLGSLWPMMCVDILESTLRLYRAGPQLAFMDLWYIDSYVDDIFLRKSHPNPFSRIRSACDAVSKMDPSLLVGQEAQHIENVYYQMESVKGSWYKWAINQSPEYQKDIHEMWSGYLHSSEIIHPSDGGSRLLREAGIPQE